MASFPQTCSDAEPDAIAPQDPIITEGELKKKKREGMQSGIEYAEQGGGAVLSTDLPAVVDIHGEVIKADWHVIRTKANEAEEYEHSLGVWQAMKTYKKVATIYIYAAVCLLLILIGTLLVADRVTLHHHGRF